MANTYTLISSQVLASSAASVTFSSIPATYTDLVLRVSARNTATASPYSVGIQFNGDTSTSYSWTNLGGTGSAAFSSNSGGAVNVAVGGFIPGSDLTANTFSNDEIYIPSYLASQNKPLGTFGVSENNATTNYYSVLASLWRNNAAITSITALANTGNFVSNSSFYLYGIKNS